MVKRLLATTAALLLAAVFSGNAWAQGAGAQTLSTLSSTYRIPVIAGNATVNQETTLATLATWLSGAGGGLNLGTGVATFLATPSGANLATALTTALPATKGGTGLTGLGAGIATLLGTPSSANLASALTDETGTGAAVFGTAPTISGAVLSGHPTVSGSAPALTSCGTSPAIVGSDVAGEVTMGTDAPTGCVITFATAFTGAPLCTVTWQATPLASQSYALSTTAITLTQTATSSNKIDYHCLARSGG